MPNPTQRPVDKRVPRARALRRDVTEAEKKLWQYLRQPPFKEHHFRRQATIGPYFADFASHERRLVIEVDGGQHFANASDAVRTQYLEANGYRVLRFWNNDVLANIEGVFDLIYASLRVEGPPPLTPPRRKRGEGKTTTTDLESELRSPQGGGEQPQRAPRKPRRPRKERK